MTRLASLLMLAAMSVAQAAPVTCLPKPVGSGTAALFKSNTKGDFAAWYCPGESLPTMFVCIKAACSLAPNKRGIAAIVNAPSLFGLNAVVTSFARDPLRDPALVKVWAPHADEIRKLAD